MSSEGFENFRRGESLQAYDPGSPGGLQVAATIIGVVGLMVALVATLAGLAIWFKVEVNWWKIMSADVFDNRFIIGLVVIFVGNVYGILILAVGKLFHFSRWVMNHGREMSEQNNLIIRRLDRLVDGAKEKS